MSIDVLEQYLRYCFNILVVIKIITWVVAWQKRAITQHTALRWLSLMLLLLMCWAITEWLFVNVVFKKSFGLYDLVKPVLDALGIKYMTFLNPPIYLTIFVCLGLFFRDLMERPLPKIFFSVFMWALVVFEIIQIVVFKSYQSYDSLSSTLKNIFIITGTGVFLYRFYQADTGIVLLFKNPYFWLALGLLLSALSEIFLEFIFTKLQTTDIHTFYKLYILRNVLQMLGFLLIIMGFRQAYYLKFLKKFY